MRLSEVFDELLEGFAVLQHIWQRQQSLRRKTLVRPNTLQAVRKKRARAWLTSLTLLIMLFRSCSSFSLFCWLVWWMICCERKQDFHPDITEGRLTVVIPSTHSVLTCLFARSSSLTLACSASCRLDFSLSTFGRMNLFFIYLDK